MHTVKLLFFASLREALGRSEEIVEIPKGVNTVADLLSWQCQRNLKYQRAFSADKQIQAAINNQHVSSNALIIYADEIALFPPVTGG
ncbi:MAG: hypothetical protein TECD_01061 [Hyphomicrobiaceae bacterium hypho_1]